jgi:ParB family chromosome partitioning protein
MNDTVRTISLAQINTADHTCRITTRTGREDLTPSIQNMGVINSPILIEKSDGFTIITGFRRIDACGNLGWHSILAKVLESSTPELACAQLAICDNALQRPLNLIEQSRSAAMLLRFIKDEASLVKAASAVGLAANPAYLKRIASLCRLPRSIQRGVSTERIPLGMALELGKLENATATRFADLFCDLKLGFNKQREVLTLTQEIARREDVGIEALFAEKALVDILSSQDMDTNLKARHLRSYLKRRRFPTITDAEDTFARCVKNMALGPGVSLKPPANFEGRRYTLTLSFQNRSELAGVESVVAHIVRDPDFGKILNR